METTEKYLLVKENSHQGCAWKKLKTKCDEASRGQQLRLPQMVEQHPSMFSCRQWQERAKASTSAKTTMDRGMIAESTLLFFFGLYFWGRERRFLEPLTTVSQAVTVARAANAKQLYRHAIELPVVWHFNKLVPTFFLFFVVVPESSASLFCTPKGGIRQSCKLFMVGRARLGPGPDCKAAERQTKKRPRGERDDMPRQELYKQIMEKAAPQKKLLFSRQSAIVSFTGKVTQSQQTEHFQEGGGSILCCSHPVAYSISISSPQRVPWTKKSTTRTQEPVNTFMHLAAPAIAQTNQTRAIHPRATRHSLQPKERQR